jgi:hypothetical protein
MKMAAIVKVVNPDKHDSAEVSICTEQIWLFVCHLGIISKSASGLCCAAKGFSIHLFVLTSAQGRLVRELGFPAKDCFHIETWLRG